MFKFENIEPKETCGFIMVYNNAEGENIIKILKKQGYEVVLLSVDGLTQEYGIRKSSKTEKTFDWRKIWKH